MGQVPGGGNAGPYPGALVGACAWPCTGPHGVVVLDLPLVSGGGGGGAFAGPCHGGGGCGGFDMVRKFYKNDRAMLL